MKEIFYFPLAAWVAAICGCTTVSEECRSTAEEYISMIKQWDDPAELASVPTMNWQSKCDYKILCSSEKFVSFKITSWSYTGGAHGMTNTRVGTVRDGRILKLADLPGNITSLWQNAVAKHFKKKSFESYLNSKPTFTPRITENFYLNTNGIHFIYDPCEINCFAAGTIDIFVPYKF